MHPSSHATARRRAIPHHHGHAELGFLHRAYLSFLVVTSRLPCRDLSTDQGQAFPRPVGMAIVLVVPLLHSPSSRPCAASTFFPEPPRAPSSTTTSSPSSHMSAASPPSDTVTWTPQVVPFLVMTPCAPRPRHDAPICSQCHDLHRPRHHLAIIRKPTGSRTTPRSVTLTPTDPFLLHSASTITTPEPSPAVRKPPLPFYTLPELVCCRR
jgi:hypothetical protein